MIENQEDIAKRRTKTEIYSRIVGYLRPIDQWNPGMTQQFHDRKQFRMNKDEENKESN